MPMPVVASPLPDRVKNETRIILNFPSNCSTFDGPASSAKAGNRSGATRVFRSLPLTRKRQ